MLVITALLYTAGRHVTFYRSPYVVLPRRRSQWITTSDEVGVSYIPMSSSTPLVFPAELAPLEGNDEWFGDGAIRQMSSLSPTIHLGANRTLMAGAASHSQPSWYDTVSTPGYPSLAQTAGQALTGTFLDGLSVDTERLQHANVVMAHNPEIVDTRDGRCKIEVLVMVPSERIGLIASRHVQCLLSMMRTLLKSLGGTEVCGAVLVSYSLLEPEFA